MSSKTSVVVAMVVTACAAPDSSPDAVPTWIEPVARIEGLQGPEAVRYDPDQDVYFVANFNGEAAGDSNGFVTRARPDGSVESQRFMVGTPEAPLHGPRGMFLTGDTLWVADALGVHGFHRRSGAQLVFVDFAAWTPGFLNDITQGPDGALYVTDTGGRRVFRLAGRTVTVALDGGDRPAPNGITWDAANGRFLLASWTEGPTIMTWDGADGLTDAGAAGMGRNDGVELVASGVIIASQQDSSLHLLANGVQRSVLRVAGRPADIGIDTRRGRVAVPYIALNRVDIWELPVQD